MTVNHGANLFDLENKLGIDIKNILDFSSNINPFGASKKGKKKVIDNIDMVSIYPDPEYKELKEAIASYVKCNRENIVLGGGATELISSFINIVNPKKTLLLSPSYSEYEKELKKIDCNIEKYFGKKENDFKISTKSLKEHISRGEYNLIIICNPNNPTGFTFKNSEIKEILEDTEAFVMVDETYVEFTNTLEYSSTSLVNEYKNLFVIRGTSKFFSTPGIRLGYGLISNEKVKKALGEKLDLWNINIFATLMGEAMFKDKEYIENTIKHMSEEREVLREELLDIRGIKVYESRGNFILCEIEKEGITSKDLYEILIKKDMIIRDCTSFEGLSNKFFRICVLKGEENKKLIKEIKNIFK